MRSKHGKSDTVAGLFAEGTLVRSDGGSRMNDLLFVTLIVGFFVVSGLYVRFCDKL